MKDAYQVCMVIIFLLGVSLLVFVCSIDCRGQVCNVLVRERMQNPENIAILDSVKDSDLVCVRGTFDHIHLVLEAIGVPFIHIDPATLTRTELRPEQTVYVNCPSSFPRDAALKLQKFVESSREASSSQLTGH